MTTAVATRSIEFVLNGRRRAVHDVAPTTTLLEWLRCEGLVGAKEGCAEGDCGACTVALRTVAADGTLATRAANACLLMLPLVHGSAIVTVEGLGAGDHPIQRAMVDRHASQCGFCTPGFVMSLWCRGPEEPASDQALEDRLAGNLCRCTGYGPILEAARCAAEPAAALHVAAAEQDAPLCAELAAVGPLDYEVAGRTAHGPVTEAAFAEAVAAKPDARIIAGATDAGIWVTKRLYDPRHMILANRVRELGGIVRHADALEVGAAVTLSRFAAAVAPLSAPLGELLRRFGGVQVRNLATVGGNIANASPIGDLAPAMIAAGARLELAHRLARRTLPLEDYFIDYGTQDRRAGEYVRAVHLPLEGLARLTCHKVSKRFDSDISAVAGAFALLIEDGTVREARLAFGGMAATPKRASHAEAALSGQRYDEAAVEAAAAALANDFTPISDQRAGAGYRLRVAQNLLRRDFVERTTPAVATRLAGSAAALLVEAA